MRPFTLIAPMIAMICGMLMALLHHGEAHRFFESYWIISLAAVAMALAQMCGQVINQAEDPVELDIMNRKGYRPVPQGQISKLTARRIGYGAGAVAFILALLISRRFGLGMAVILFFAIFYSVEPVRGKRRKIINALWLGVSRGFLPLLIAWSIFYSPWHPVPLVLAVILFIWVSAFNITKDFPDLAGDSAYHIPTFPALFGVDRTKTFMQWMNGAALCGLITAIAIDILPPGFLLACPIFLFAAIVIHRINRKSPKRNPVENNSSWMFYYLGLGGLYILFTLAMVIA